MFGLLARLMGRLEDDPMMDDRLLKVGWAGLLTLEEARFIAGALADDRKLRRAWSFRKRVRYPLNLIAARAYPEDVEEGMAHLVRMQAADRRGPSDPSAMSDRARQAAAARWVQSSIPEAQ